MIYLKQSTASQEIPLGPFLDVSDGDTEETGLTIANTDIKLWKAGATALVSKNSGGATHAGNGVYYATLDATDTDTLGSMSVYVHVSGALFVKQECVVLAANVYDSLIAGSDLLQIDLAQISGDATAADNLELMYDGTGYTDSNAPASRDQANSIAAAIAALNDVSVSDLLTTQMTESYAANGVAPTLTQAILAIHNHLMNCAISGVTHRTYQLDSVTTAFDSTLDDETNPATIRRVP